MIEIEKKFSLTKEQQDTLQLSAKFLGTKEVIDSYFDNETFDLTKRDIWLRKRNEQFELKVSKDINVNRKADQYDEIENEFEIRKLLKIENNGSLSDDIAKAGYLPFTQLKSIRLKYQKDAFAIDIDEVTAPDFSYALAEIELMVENESKIEEATQKIIEFAKSNGLQTDTYVRGKVVEYIRLKRPAHFEALVKAGVVK